MIGPEELTAAWFEQALTPRYPGIRVASADVTSVKEMTNTHVWATLSYDGRPALRQRVFVKLPPIDTKRRELLGTSTMGVNEARFYERLAPVLELRVPVPHAAFVEDDGGFVMVLEDLEASGCTPYDGQHGRDPRRSSGRARRACRDARALRATGRKGRPRLDRAAEDGPPGESRRPDISTKLLRRGLEKYRDRIGDAYAAVAERLLADRAAVNALWAAAPPTVVHGDLHIGNLFDDHGRVGFFDWGLMAVADPLRDASYFLCLALDIEVRRGHERDLLSHYLDARQGWEAGTSAGTRRGSGTASGRRTRCWRAARRSRSRTALPSRPTVSPTLSWSGPRPPSTISTLPTPSRAEARDN